MREFRVDGMSCDGCTNAVERAIASVAPGVQISVDLGRATVTVDGTADTARIAEAVGAAGFTFVGPAD